MTNEALERTALFIEASTIKVVRHGELKEGMLVLNNGNYWRISDITREPDPIRSDVELVGFTGRIIDPEAALYRTPLNGARYHGRSDIAALVVIEQ